jgi:hypothetical protein
MRAARTRRRPPPCSPRPWNTVARRSQMGRMEERSAVSGSRSLTPSLHARRARFLGRGV